MLPNPAVANSLCSTGLERQALLWLCTSSHCVTYCVTAFHQLLCVFCILPAQVMADFAAERASVVSVATAQVNAAGSEVEALRRLLRLKGRELQQLRHLAQEVLLQRSEVEIFLLSSLHQVGLRHVGGGVLPLAQTTPSLGTSTSSNRSGGGRTHMGLVTISATQ